MSPTEIIREELMHNFPDLRQEKPQVEAFLQHIQPEINEAVTTGDPDLLRPILDRLKGRTARASLKTIHRERNRVVLIVYTALRVMCRCDIVS